MLAPSAWILITSLTKKTFTRRQIPPQNLFHTRALQSFHPFETILHKQLCAIFIHRHFILLGNWSLLRQSQQYLQVYIYHSILLCVLPIMKMKNIIPQVEISSKQHSFGTNWAISEVIQTILSFTLSMTGSVKTRYSRKRELQRNVMQLLGD